MNIEFEATYLQVDKDDVRGRLREAGAFLVHEEYLMKRSCFSPPHPVPGGWMRVRREYDQITMSYKVVNGTKITDQKEVELVIDSFEDGEEFLISIGATKKSYQETKRELWRLDDVDITIDTWPGLYPFVEVEGEGEEVVKQVSEKIGFDYSDAVFCEVSFIYEKELGIPADIMKDEMPIITFEHVPQKYER